MNADTIELNERVTLNVKLFEELLSREYERGKADGSRGATELYIREHYGSTTYVIMKRATSRRALSRLAASYNVGHIDTGCGHDCSGQVCGRFATLLRAYKAEANDWIGVIEITTSYDV